MNILKKIFFIILSNLLIVLILYSSIINNYVYASDENTETMTTTTATVEEARQQIANFALKFQSEHSGDVDYDKFWSFETIKIKRYNTYVTEDSPGKLYEFDCVGWVTFAINRAIDIGCDNPKGSGFVTTGGIKDSRFQSVSTSSLIPGDIVWCSSHIAIYVGNGKIVDMWCSRYGNEFKPSGGLKVRNLNGTYHFGNAARLISLDGVNFTPVEGGFEVVEGDENGSSNNFDTEEVDLDEIANKFDFSGMATTVIKENQKADVFSWFFEGIGGFVDYLAGIILTIAIKAPILGYTNTILNLINSFLQGLN